MFLPNIIALAEDTNRGISLDMMPAQNSYQVILLRPWKRVMTNTNNTKQSTVTSTYVLSKTRDRSSVWTRFIINLLGNNLKLVIQY